MARNPRPRARGSTVAETIFPRRPRLRCRGPRRNEIPGGNVLGTMIRRSAKAAVLPAGLLSRRRVGDVVILLYHRIGVSREEIELPAETFAAQLEHLATSGI